MLLVNSDAVVTTTGVALPPPVVPFWFMAVTDAQPTSALAGGGVAQPPVPVVPAAPVVPATPVVPAAPVVPPRPAAPVVPATPVVPAAPVVPPRPPAPVVPPPP